MKRLAADHLLHMDDASDWCADNVLIYIYTHAGWRTMGLYASSACVNAEADL